MEFIKREDVKWSTVKIIKKNTDGPAEQHPYKYQFELPYPLSAWDVYDYWEKERFASMEKHLKRGDILFDIGTEQGWCNLIYAQFVGPENMVLIEPTPEFWPNIMQTWEKNYSGKEPLAFYDGLLSNKTTDNRKKGFTTWPDASGGDQVDRNSYKYIHEHGDVVPQMTVDDYIKRTGIVPDALTMDVEGAEFLIITGALDTLQRHKPKLWISVHPDLARENYNVESADLFGVLEKIGYKSEFLATDHEEHWYFS